MYGDWIFSLVIPVFFGTIFAAQLTLTLYAQQPAPPSEKTGKQLFEAACAACHGMDGKGVLPGTLGFETPVPDFSECSFASREPDEDWLAIIHEGGPVRAFDRMMPSFRDALTTGEMQRILDHVRGFCGDAAWPRGELNLPRPLVTEKAYPEDEAVLEVAAAAEGLGDITQNLIYERRFGSRSQIEFVLPFGFSERAPGSWRGGVGDIAVAAKHTLVHSLNTGSILSAGGEIVLPTGNKSYGLGTGLTKFEPFAAFGQMLPGAGFLQFHGGLEIPTRRDNPDEAFWRTAVGKTFTHGGYGRVWSPMVELLGARELDASEQTHWDIVPQVQISLSKRQHVLLSAGVRVPVNDAASRSTEVMMYVIWDWFDGGLFSGW